MRAAHEPSCPTGEPCLAHLCASTPGCVRRRKASFEAVAATGATPLYLSAEDRFVADPDIARRGP